VPCAARRYGRAVGAGTEVAGVHAARHDRHPPPGHPHRGEFAHLVGAGGEDAGAGAADPPFDAQAFGRAGVPPPLVAPLDGAEGVERLHHRDAVRAGTELGGQAGHPEVGVHDVRPVAAPGPGEVGAEGGHVGQQLVLGDGLGGSGGHVLDDRPAGQRHPVGQVGRVPAGVHRDVVAAPGQLLAEPRHVHVLAAGVDAAERGERARVLGHHGDPHRVTSFRSRSPSSGERDSP
jgi:hypothetical protein